MALQLVEPSKRKHAETDTKQYRSLTELGQQVHMFARRWLMDVRVSNAPGSEAPEEPDTSVIGTAEAQAVPTGQAAKGEPRAKRRAKRRAGAEPPP